MAESVTVVGATKRFSADSRPALEDVSFEVEPGTFLVLLGPSGSGKTTLLRCLAGIERLTSGEISIGGRTVASARLHAPPEERSLSMVFQDYALWPHLRVRENVAFALRRAGLDRAACRRGAAAMLDRVGLSALSDRYPSELSGGEQQRVALARALVADTQTILCDEPISNLDADLRERLRVEIASLVRGAGATALYITHDQSEAFALADRIGVLEHGRLVQIDSPEAVYLWPASPFVARFTGLAGELAVRVLGRDPENGSAICEAGGGTPFLARVAKDSNVEGGTVMVRPHAVTLTAPEDEARHCIGVVSDVAFRGHRYDHVVDLPDGTRITGVAAPHRSERQSVVGLQLDPSGCLLFADHEAGAGLAATR